MTIQPVVGVYGLYPVDANISKMRIKRCNIFRPNMEINGGNRLKPIYTLTVFPDTNRVESPDAYSVHAMDAG